MGTDYYGGDGPAKVTPDQIPYVFRKQTTIGRTVAGMNNVFMDYYRAYHALDQATIHASGTKTYKALSDLQGKIRADLRDAASEKSMINLKVPFTDIRMGGAGQSLYDVFHDLSEHGGVLKCDDTAGNNVFLAPPGVFAFQDQMIARGTEIATCQGEFNRWQANMKVWKGKQAWDGLGTNLDMGQKVIDKVGYKMWACIGFPDKNATAFNVSVVKWWSYGAKVKSLMDSYIAVKSSTNGQAQLVAEVAGFVVDFLPVFGSAYGGVIRAIPQAMKFFQDRADLTNQYVNMASGR
ncbi:MAG: hypothetical protein ABSH47_06640 [Bryobacteraceae bacterium]|jgi:hypothetical protein